MVDASSDVEQRDRARLLQAQPVVPGGAQIILVRSGLVPAHEADTASEFFGLALDTTVLQPERKPPRRLRFGGTNFPVRPPSEVSMRILSVLRWSLVAAILTLLIAPAAVGLATGTQLVVVEGKSMSPTYELGDIVMIGPPTETDFAPGTVVTVGTPRGAMYTHRIVNITNGKAQLKGDGNAAEDPDTVSYSQLVGAVRGHISSPLSDLLAYAQTLPARLSLAILILALILIPIENRRGAESVPAGSKPGPAGHPSASDQDAQRERGSNALDIFTPRTAKRDGS